MRDQGTRTRHWEDAGEMRRIDRLWTRVDVRRLDDLKANLDWLRLFPLIGSTDSHDPGDEDRS